MASQARFDIPSGAVAQVHIIDSTVRITHFPVNLVLTPPVHGFDQLPPLASWSFLVQSSKGKKVLFDLSILPDFDSYPPALFNILNQVGVKIEASKHVSEVLKENGVEPSEIGSVIWRCELEHHGFINLLTNAASHHHWDHIGDITTFPETTEIVVGPGFKDTYLPGYPAQQDSPLRQDYLEGRTVREVDFATQSPVLKAGGFQIYDFFGDGSFYLLDAPGHTKGHLAGLARTTTDPDTFIFMGGDLCHHGGEIRPSAYLPIPAEVHFSLQGFMRSRVPACPGGAVFEGLNVKRGRRVDEPFFEPAFADNMIQTMQTIKDAQEADAQRDVFFIFAHDMGIAETVDFFPQSVNDWKNKGWREKALWNFLADLTLPAISTD